MVRIVLPIASLLTSQVLLWLGAGLLSTIIALRMGSAGYDSLTGGLVMSGFYVGLVLSALRADRVIRAVGHIRAFAAMASVLSAATLAHGFDDDPVLWWCLRAIEGMCIAGLSICTESWLNDRSTNADRGTILSIYTLTTGVATGAGQFLLNLSEISGFTLLVVASMLLSLALVPVTMTRGPTPSLGTVSWLGLGKLWRISPLGVTGCFTAGLAIGGFNSMGPVYGQASGMGVSQVSFFMGVAIIGGMVLQMPMGRLSDLLPRRLVVMGAGLGLCVTALLVGALTLGGGAKSLEVMLLVVVFGGCIYILYPLALAQTNDSLTPDQFLGASGGLVLIYGIGAIIGPILSSLAMDRFGPSGLFWLMAVIGIGLALTATLRMAYGPTMEVEDQTPYQMVPRTTVVAMEMDPRLEDEQFLFEFMTSTEVDESPQESESPA